MKQLRITSAAAVLALGVVGCETRTADNDIDHTDRTTTSTRIDSGTITNDRMNTGNPNDRMNRTSTGGSTGGTITNDTAGIDRTTGSDTTGTGASTGSR